MIIWVRATFCLSLVGLIVALTFSSTIIEFFGSEESAVIQPDGSITSETFHSSLSAGQQELKIILSSCALLLLASLGLMAYAPKSWLYGEQAGKPSHPGE